MHEFSSTLEQRETSSVKERLVSLPNTSVIQMLYQLAQDEVQSSRAGLLIRLVTSPRGRFCFDHIRLLPHLLSLPRQPPFYFLGVRTCVCACAHMWDDSVNFIMASYRTMDTLPMAIPLKKMPVSTPTSFKVNRI